ncbi:hypothetical protein [Nonomuraea sp. NPDC003201]
MYGLLADGLVFIGHNQPGRSLHPIADQNLQEQLGVPIHCGWQLSSMGGGLHSLTPLYASAVIAQFPGEATPTIRSTV